MKKARYMGLCILIFIIIIICVVWFCRHSAESHSVKNNNEDTQSIIDVYSELYSHEFEPASVQIEDRLFGIWQAKEFVGWDNSREICWDGLYGDIIIFSEDAWGGPEYRPVYACYLADFEDMEQDLFLNIAWKDNRYEGCSGIVGIAVSSEKDNSRGAAQERKVLKFIIIEDDVIIETNESYFRLEKVGEIEMNDLFENVSPQ